VFSTEEALSPGNRAELDRRLVLQTGVATALAAGGALALGGATAAIGRAARGSGQPPAAGGLTPQPPASQTPSTSGPADSSSASAAGPTASGTVIGTTSQVPVGQARQFTDPASGQPAWMVHPSGSVFVAFSAVCTHAGCPVQYDSANVQFVCPCHGGVYDARTGQVLQGPPPGPLPSIPVHVVAGQLRVDG
jgi:thiosulfate dehydrogenase [quinone] large subunit